MILTSVVNIANAHLKQTLEARRETQKWVKTPPLLLLPQEVRGAHRGSELRPHSGNHAAGTAVFHLAGVCVTGKCCCSLSQLLRFS